jgi:hypothetical protein
MGDMRTIKVTSEMRAEALRKVHTDMPRALRLEPGHLRWIARVDTARETAAQQGEQRRAS